MNEGYNIDHTVWNSNNEPHSSLQGIVWPPGPQSAPFSVKEIVLTMGYLIRFQGKWYTLQPKPFEPERMTTDIAWSQLKDQLTPQEAYRQWFKQQIKISRFFQQ
jgi:hypothetical protein